MNIGELSFGDNVFKGGINAPKALLRRSPGIPYNRRPFMKGSGFTNDFSEVIIN